MKPIVLVGKRSSAIEAVRALGYTPITLVIAGRPEQARNAYGGSLAQDKRKLDERLNGARPVAVLATAEGSVPVAAALAEHYAVLGNTPKAAHLAHNKLAMKRVIHAAGIQCAPWAEVLPSTTAEELADTLGFPMVLKIPVSSGGRGVRIVKHLDELRSTLAPGMLAEAFVRGTEMSMETFLLHGRTLLRNPTRYLVPGWSNIVPAALAPTDLIELNGLAERVQHALGLTEGMTHMEVFLTETGPVFGEIAARPPGGRLMNLLALVYEFDPWQALVRLALGEEPNIPTESKRFAGAHVLYPPPGILKEVHGVERARQLEGVLEIKCNARPGDVIERRLGTGQNKGHVLVSHRSMAGCEECLRRAAGAIRFEVQ